MVNQTNIQRLARAPLVFSIAPAKGRWKGTSGRKVIARNNRETIFTDSLPRIEPKGRTVAIAKWMRIRFFLKEGFFS
ncbi:MAG: hypothetical protein F3742_00115 [Nitrospinae bacterium]|nr:hypothetical protein [Nitrospinota bacterium]